MTESWMCIGLGCALMLGGCGRPAPPVHNRPAATATNTRHASVSPEKSQELFRDDFSTPGGEWLRHSGKELIAEYVNGRYRLWSNQDKRQYAVTLSYSGHDFSDVRVEVTATRVGGYAGNAIGLFCRAGTGGDSSLYFADIDGEGEARLGKYVNDEQTILAEDDAAPLFAKGTRKLSLVCDRDRLSFSLDGVVLLTAQDGSLRDGDVGLSAGGAGSGTIDVLFDDFVVTAPNAGD